MNDLKLVKFIHKKAVVDDIIVMKIGRHLVRHVFHFRANLQFYIRAQLTDVYVVSTAAL